MHVALSDLVDIKAKALCYGIRCSAGLRRKIVSARMAEPGFIHGAVLVLNGQLLVNTSVVDDAYSLLPDAPELILNDVFYLRAGDVMIPVEFMAQPDHAHDAYEAANVSDYLRLHSPTTLFATPVRQCAYITANRPCTFCTFERGRIERLSANQLVDLVMRFRESTPAIRSIAFGGGSPNLRDFGAAYYAKLASAAKGAAGLETSVEIVPARRTDHWMDFLRSGGVDAVISSIEIWDDAIREKVCIGKSELPKSHYLERWSQAVDVLGPGSVSSVLLAGLEDVESTRAGALALVSHGVIPTIIPYRPYRASSLGPATMISPMEFLSLSREVRAALAAAGLSPLEQSGCTSCGACSLELNTVLGDQHRVPAAGV